MSEKNQISNLEGLKDLPGIASDNSITEAIDKAVSSTQDLQKWLEEKGWVDPATGKKSREAREVVAKLQDLGLEGSI